ncbi:DUF6527 family protein [Stenotrophomonas sp. PS02301]|uniref:DUF6527 family protein n=1 Tax=Stenotrophomonas sp. PS02301 TaxID=2991427 RepID=UPI00249B0091|nr:DUF6527 family protein [Stenotrophomonas sp. PS02301]
MSFKCPGCRLYHTLPVQGAGTTWQFNGDVESPTLSPSILARGGCCYESEWHVQEKRRHLGPEHCDKHHPDEDGVSMCHTCHSFVREGQIEFLSDYTHALAGTTVPLTPAMH